MANRKKALAAVVITALLFGAGGWYMGQRVSDPEEIQAAVEPPPRSLITVPVEARELSDDVVTRVSVLFDNTSGVRLATDVTANEPAVITGRVPERGTELANGSILTEINERPFFVLEGELPASRTLRPGSEGPDVEQLEQALADLGFFSGSPDDVFDEGTEAAILALYEAEGYSAPDLTSGEKAEREQKTEAVQEAEKALADAEEALEEASVAETESQRLQRILDWEQTVKAWQDAQVEATRWRENDPQISSAVAVEEAADEAYREALERLQQAERGDHPDTDEAPTPDDITGFRAVADQLGKALIEAREDTAEVLAESTAQADAAERLELQRRQFEIAQVSYQERLNNLVPDTSLQEEQVEARQEALADAQEQLDELEARLGAYIPDFEFTFVSNLPRTISQVNFQRGAFVRSDVDAVRVSGDTLLVEGAIGENNRAELSAGQRVIIDDPGLDLEIEGTFSRLDDVTDGSSDYPGRYYFTVDLEGEFDPEQLVNIGNFRMVIPIGRTEGEALAVPRNALRTTFDDQAQVLVEREPGTTEFVDVTLGLQPELGGYVEVIPVNAGELSVGDQVVVEDPDRTSGGDSDGDDTDGDDTDGESDGDAEGDADAGAGSGGAGDTDGEAEAGDDG